MAETPAPVETDNIKKKALARLATAGAVTLIALAGLWWLDNATRDPTSSKPTPPAPIISAPLATPAPVPEPLAPAPEEAVSEPAEPEASPTAPPPPPRVGEFPKPAVPGKTASSANTVPPAVVPASPARAPTTQEPQTVRPVPPPILANAAPPAGRGFVVQLGVFTDPGNAQDLVSRLKKQGIRAYTETRVHVGPFMNREEADKAQAELRRLGISGVVGATK